MSGEEPPAKRKGGRRPRPKPNAGAGQDWLAEPFLDPIQETARQFASNLDQAIKQRWGDVSGHTAAKNLGVDHNVLRRVLAGMSYPDLVFIARVELKLKRRVWPSRVR
ncbi:hypothetical protein [Leifsonia aquatica]|uniref:XRE family transcriptional regulator n=1 Tax=Leifsonia aquatica TaxID=144185 RepID=A0A7W4UYE8_LEIAQ|nr:hypothetical protein [Leifsonia aquatica]MBB2967998.1 hypothetical protein [Leifsonia aquatica]